MWADPAPGTHCVWDRFGEPTTCPPPRVWREHTQEKPQLILFVLARESHDMLTHIAVFQISPLLKGYNSR